MKTSFRLLLLAASLLPLAAVAQHSNTLDEETLKQANNPLAKVRAFNVHDYYAPSVFADDEVHSNQLLMRYAQPIGKWLIRATLPFATTTNPEYLATGTGSKYVTGLGDVQIFGAYAFHNKGGLELAVGPMLIMPTATDTYLGEGKWQGGLSFIAFVTSNPQFQWGSLVTWQMSFAGNSDRTDVNKMVFQPFGMWQLGNGLYLRSASFWTFGLSHGEINIPFSVGIGKVFKVNKTVFNIFVEPQYSAINYRYDNAPRFQVFTGVNMQFH